MYRKVVADAEGKQKIKKGEKKNQLKNTYEQSMPMTTSG